MGSLSQAKTLGGIGSILTLLGIVPFAGTALEITGWILVLIAIKYVSEAVQDRSIYKNAIIAAVLAMVGAVVGGLVVGFSIFRFMSLGSMTSTTPPPSLTSPGISGLIPSIIAGLVVLWVLAIIASFFLRRSYNTVATRLNIGLFRTGALIYLIGSILTIVLVGFLLAFVAQILFVVAFFSLPEGVPGTVGFTPPPSPTVPSTSSTTTATAGAPNGAGTKFCVKCGASMDRAASFCPSCGASQPMNA